MKINWKKIGSFSAWPFVWVWCWFVKTGFAQWFVAVAKRVKDACLVLIGKTEAVLIKEMDGK